MFDKQHIHMLSNSKIQWLFQRTWIEVYILSALSHHQWAYSLWKLFATLLRIYCNTLGIVGMCDQKSSTRKVWLLVSVWVQLLPIRILKFGQDGMENTHWTPAQSSIPEHLLQLRQDNPCLAPLLIIWALKSEYQQHCKFTSRSCMLLQSDKKRRWIRQELKIEKSKGSKGTKAQNFHTAHVDDMQPCNPATRRIEWINFYALANEVSRKAVDICCCFWRNFPTVHHCIFIKDH